MAGHVVPPQTVVSHRNAAGSTDAKKNREVRGRCEQNLPPQPAKGVEHGEGEEGRQYEEEEPRDNAHPYRQVMEYCPMLREDITNKDSNVTGDSPVAQNHDGSATHQPSGKSTISAMFRNATHEQRMKSMAYLDGY